MNKLLLEKLILQGLRIEPSLEVMSFCEQVEKIFSTHQMSMLIREGETLAEIVEKMRHDIKPTDKAAILVLHHNNTSIGVEDVANITVLSSYLGLAKIYWTMGSSELCAPDRLIIVLITHLLEKDQIYLGIFS